MSAILDFEFAAPDARALDVATSLPPLMRVWEHPQPWETVRRFYRGYARWVRLTQAEIAALPWLMRLRSAMGALWWMGRALAAGNVRPALRRIEYMRTLVRWLARHEQQVVDVVRQAAR